MRKRGGGRGGNRGRGRPKCEEGRKIIYLRETVFKLWYDVKASQENTKGLSNSEYAEYLLTNLRRATNR